MNNYWILIADAARARIFVGEGPIANLTEIEDLLNPRARSTDGEMGTDAKGQYSGHRARQQGHSAEPRTDPHEHEKEIFARRLARRLDAARQDKAYASLYLVAAPKLLGLLRENLSLETARLVSGTLARDVSQLSGRTLEAYLRDNIAG